MTLHVYDLNTSINMTVVSFEKVKLSEKIIAAELQSSQQ